MRRRLVPLLAAALLATPLAAEAATACDDVRAVEGTNPSPATLAGHLAAAAAAHDVPVQVLKAIAFQETGWRPFNPDGTAKVSNDGACGVGLMQITLGSRTDGVRLASDVAYNAAEGAKILAAKWTELQNQTHPYPAGEGYGPDDRHVLENWYASICRYNGCLGTDADLAYAQPVARLVHDPFQQGVPSGIVAHMPPAGFTTPRDAKEDYVFPGGFQAQADDEFHFYDGETGAVTGVVQASTHTDAPFSGYPVGYGPGGPNVSCGDAFASCQWWRPAEGFGMAGWAHWTYSVEGAGTNGVRVTWRPPGTGDYGVRAFVADIGEPLAPAATYRFGDGTSQVVDQNASKGLSVWLGRHTLSPANAVWLGDGSTVAGAKIVADAVQFQAYTTLSLAASPAAVTYGRSTALTIRLAQVNGGGLPGHRVLLWKRRAGVLGYTQVGSYVTGTDGKVAVRATPSTNSYYKATFAADSAAFAATDAVRRVDVRQAVSATLSRTSVPRGTAVRISARVAPSHSGQQVTLQRYSSGAWRTVSTVNLSSTSTASWSVRPSARGTYYYRVHKPADSDHAAGTSARLTLKVT